MQEGAVVAELLPLQVPSTIPAKAMVSQLTIYILPSVGSPDLEADPPRLKRTQR